MECVTFQYWYAMFNDGIRVTGRSVPSGIYHFFVSVIHTFSLLAVLKQLLISCHSHHCFASEHYTLFCVSSCTPLPFTLKVFTARASGVSSLLATAVVLYQTIAILLEEKFEAGRSYYSLCLPHTFYLAVGQYFKL